MKIRNDYVSNSSSSSFIVIADGGTDETYEITRVHEHHSKEWNALEVPTKEGKHQFGWEWEDTHDFVGKLNFAAIQLLYLFIDKCNKRKRDWKPKYTGKDFDRLYDMLVKVCKEKFGIIVKLNEHALRFAIWQNVENGYYGHPMVDAEFYIDHQSACTEDSCMEMFDSEEKLHDFLRYKESHVQGGNDQG